MKVLGYIGSIPELVPLLAERRYAPGITSCDLDLAAGTADGHVSKIEAGTKRLGHITIPSLLGALALRLAVVAVEDDAALPRATQRLLYTSRDPRAAKRPPAALPIAPATIQALADEPAPQPALALLAA
jgi:hypothetical protein